MDRYDDLDLECDGGGVAQKPALFGGMFKRSFKSAEPSVQAQDSSSASGELSKRNDSLTDNSTKEKEGVFKGMFKKTTKTAKEGQPQDLLDNKLTASNDSLSENIATKETGGMFSGMFKKSPKPFGGRTQPQEDFSAPNELSGSNDSLSVNINTKDDLSADGELSARVSLIEKPSKGEVAAKILKNPFTSSSQDKEKTQHSGDSNENTSTTEKPKDKQEKNTDSDCEETLDNGEGQASHKQSKPPGAMTKLNPFRSAKYEKQAGDEDPPASSEKSSGNKQKDTEEMLKENEKQVEEKVKAVKSNMIQRERKERNEMPPVPPRPTEEAVISPQEMKGISTYDKVKPRGTEYNQDYKDMISREKKAKPAETPVVPARPSEEELNRAARRGLQKQKSHHQSQSDDESLKKDESAEAKEGGEANSPESKTTMVKKHKHRNPFMPQAAAKGKVIQRQAQGGAAGNTDENEGGNRSLFDKLEDFRIDPAQPEDRQDVENLMEWWNTVESWEDTPQDDEMTEKQEAKAFAVTADKVQKGIRVFNKLFSERAESLWQHVIDLNSIADGLDKFNKNTKIAQITGGSTSAIGGVTTITGLALAPLTMGVSLIVTAVGLGVATAGGLTSAGAGISNQVNNSMDRKKVEKIVQDYQEKMVDLNKCLTFIKQGIENLKKFDLIKMKKTAYNRDFPALNSSFYADGAMAGKAILSNLNEIMRVVHMANVAGSTAARAVQIASMATGVLTGLFVGMDIYFVAKDSKELKKGAKSEFAAKIREVTTQLHEGLVELNGIREELQSTSPKNNAGNVIAALDSNKKEKDNKYDSSDEHEIDRIKKAIEKDIENREYDSSAAKFHALIVRKCWIAFHMLSGHTSIFSRCDKQI
ncbi:LOW QUALITY PROTEIN: apolipoprotein L1 [Siniperca chuatsi]|uniref:LOW QUALITY PROTEIN: apolipoprotein L1 n=1 Tax=Siniperca chuatsi TaxID=119488 RepID=UPI001CE20AD6|nr:LOW QUALITY PROTEIN: apolipoprotein L1 [Siniperca chuatsi]